MTLPSTIAATSPLPSPIHPLPVAMLTPTLAPATPTTVVTPLGDGFIPIKRIVTNVTFDSPDIPFGLIGNYAFKDGVLILEDKIVSGDPWADGSSQLGYGAYHPVLGNGTILLFRTDENEPPPDNYWGPIYEVGPWGDPAYKSIWYIFDSWRIYEGDVDTAGNSLVSKRFESDFSIEPGVWYYIFFRLHPDGMVESLVWPKGNPAHVSRLVVQMDENWVRSPFSYNVHVPEGRVEIDAFQEVELATDDLIALP